MGNTARYQTEDEKTAYYNSDIYISIDGVEIKKMKYSDYLDEYCEQTTLSSGIGACAGYTEKKYYCILDSDGYENSNQYELKNEADLVTDDADYPETAPHRWSDLRTAFVVTHTYQGGYNSVTDTLDTEQSAINRVYEIHEQYTQDACDIPYVFFDLESAEADLAVALRESVE